MRILLIIAVAVTPLWGAFDVQTSWIRSSLVEATGSETTPDNIDQTITGDPATTYSETYEKNITRVDSGILNFANLSYQINSTQSPQGVVAEYTFTSDASPFGTLLNQSGATTEFHYSATTEFSASESFNLTTSLFTIGGQINDFSLWVDGTLLWSALSGFPPTPVPDEGGEYVAIYGKDTGFELQIVSIGADPSPADGLRLFELTGLFGDAEPAHDIEVRFDWSQIATESGSTGASLFEYDLELAAVPEASAMVIPLFTMFYVFWGRGLSRRMSA